MNKKEMITAYQYNSGWVAVTFDNDEWEVKEKINKQYHFIPTDNEMIELQTEQWAKKVRDILITW